MPQFEFSSVFLPQVVWLAFFFAILYFGVVRLTLPKVGRVMQAREDQVENDLTTAETAKAESDRIQAEYDAGLAAAHDAARAKINEARSAAAKSLEAKLAESNAALHKRAEAADRQLADARGKAMAEIEGVAADAAAAIVEKLTGARPSADAAAGAARAALD